MTDSKTNDSLFQTPNPTKLKQAAKQDPLQERSDSAEADVIETDSEDKTEPGHEGAVEMVDSQVTKANLSGH